MEREEGGEQCLVRYSVVCKFCWFISTAVIVFSLLAGEGTQCSLQADINGHAVAADYQRGLRNHEFGG